MRRNKDIEVIRAIAILYMLIYHFAMSITGIPKTNNLDIFIESFGQFALIGFFVLSGFGTYISFWTKESRNKEITFSEYIKHRLKAILPQYYFSLGFILLLTFGIGYLNFDNLKYVIQSIILVQNFDPANGINGVTWTLAVLMQLCLIAIPLYRLVKKYGLKIYLILFIFTIILKKLIFNYIMNMGLDSSLYVVMSIRIPLTTIDLFVIGMCVAKLYLFIKDRNISIRFSKFISLFICIFTLIVYHIGFYVFCTKVGMIYDNRWICCVWQSVIGILIAVFCFFLSQLGFHYKTRLGRCIQFIAHYEYGMYLWHMILMGNFILLQTDIYVKLNNEYPLVLMIAMIVLTIICGYISTQLTKSEEYLKHFSLLNEK